MNKRKLELIGGIAGTLGIAVLLCFWILHYSSLRLSLPALYMVLFGPSLIGMFASVYPYMREVPETKDTFETLPTVSEDEIFEKTRRDKTEEKTEAPADPEVVPPERQIVPVNIDVNAPDALKKALLAKVLMEINRTDVSIDINTKMDLDGQFKDPDINIGFHTPPKKTEEKKQAPASDPPKKDEERTEQLHKARI